MEPVLFRPPVSPASTVTVGLSGVTLQGEGLLWKLLGVWEPRTSSTGKALLLLTHAFLSRVKASQEFPPLLPNMKACCTCAAAEAQDTPPGGRLLLLLVLEPEGSARGEVGGNRKWNVDVSVQKQTTENTR